MNKVSILSILLFCCWFSSTLTKPSEDLDQVLKEAIQQKEQAKKDIELNKNDKFVAKLISNGLKSFKSKAVVEYYQSVDTSNLSQFSNYLAQSLQVPNNKKEAFLDTINSSVWMDINDWKEISFVFQVSKGEAKYISVVTALDDEAQTLDFLISDVKSTFEIGDDIFVSTYCKKKYWGLTSKTVLKIQKVPAELSQKSIELIFKFFRIVAIERFAEFRKIPL